MLALHLACEDGIYMPFVENAKEILPLLKDISQEKSKEYVCWTHQGNIYRKQAGSLSAGLRGCEPGSSLGILTKENRKSHCWSLTERQM